MPSQCPRSWPDSLPLARVARFRASATHDAARYRSGHNILPVDQIKKVFLLLNLLPPTAHVSAEPTIRMVLLLPLQLSEEDKAYSSSSRSPPHLDTIASAKVVDRPKVMESTPHASNPNVMTGFRPNRSAKHPQGYVEMTLPIVNALVNQLV